MAGEPLKTGLERLPTGKAQGREGCLTLRAGLLARRLKGLSPFHLLLQKGGRHAGVALGLDGQPLQAEQVGRTPEWLPEGLVGLVDACGPLQGNPLLGRPGRSKSIGMDDGLNALAGLIELMKVDLKSHGQPEQHKVILIEPARLHDRLRPGRIHRSRTRS